MFQGFSERVQQEGICFSLSGKFFIKKKNFPQQASQFPWCLALVQTPDLYFSLCFSFHKAIQELIKVSEGDMRKVRWETAMIGNVFLLKLTSFVTLISHSVKKYGEIRFFFKKEDSHRCYTSLVLKSTSGKGLKKLHYKTLYLLIWPILAFLQTAILKQFAL